MTWAALIPVIVEHGIPYAYKLWAVITKYPEPTPEAWKELLEFANKTHADYIKEARANLGLL